MFVGGVVAAVLATTSCSPAPDPPPEAVEPSVAVHRSWGGAEEGDRRTPFDSLEVSFRGLPSCDGRTVETRIGARVDGVFDGASLDISVPASGATYVATLDSLSVAQARGSFTWDTLVAIVRCGNDDVATLTTPVAAGMPVASTSAPQLLGGTQTHDELLAPDGGSLFITSVVDPSDASRFVLSLETFAADGTPRGVHELGSVASTFFLSAEANYPLLGPGLALLPDGRIFVRIFDDRDAASAAYAAVVDVDGSPLLEWNDRTILQATLVGDRLVFLRGPDAGTAASTTTPEFTVDVVDAATGNDVVAGLPSGRTIYDFAADGVGAAVTAVTDDGVDLAGGTRAAPRLLVLRAGQAPQALPVPTPAGTSTTDIVALPGAVDGRFLALHTSADQTSTTVETMRKSAAGDAVEVVDTLGTFGGGVVAGAITPSARGGALAVSLAQDGTIENGVLTAAILYFKQGGLACVMRTTTNGNAASVVSEHDFVLLGQGLFATTCNEEATLAFTIGTSIGETDDGMSTIVLTAERTVRATRWWPIDQLVPLGSPLTFE